MADTPGFTGWALVEVMGHRQLAGYVGEQPIAGGTLVRVDVPATEPEGADDDPRPTPAYTTCVGVQSLYALTPCDEATARAAARLLERAKLPWQPRALAAGATTDEDDDDEEYPF